MNEKMDEAAEALAAGADLPAKTGDRIARGFRRRLVRKMSVFVQDAIRKESGCADTPATGGSAKLDWISLLLGRSSQELHLAGFDRLRKLYTFLIWMRTDPSCKSCIS